MELFKALHKIMDQQTEIYLVKSNQNSTQYVI